MPRLNNWREHRSHGHASMQACQATASGIGKSHKTPRNYSGNPNGVSHAALIFVVEVVTVCDGVAGEDPGLEAHSGAAAAHARRRGQQQGVVEVAHLRSTACTAGKSCTAWYQRCRGSGPGTNQAQRAQHAMRCGGRARKGTVAQPFLVAAVPNSVALHTLSHCCMPSSRAAIPCCSPRPHAPPNRHHPAQCRAAACVSWAPQRPTLK